MLGGLDWTGTALGRAFKSQEQVLFLFASFIFIISVTLHLFSIPEQPFTPGDQLKAAESGESSSNLSLTIGQMVNLLDAVAEEDITAPVAQREGELEPQEELDFLDADRVRSKSDSVLAMPDSTVKLDPDLDPDLQHFHPEVHHFLPDTGAELEDVFKASPSSNGLTSPTGRPAITDENVVPARSELDVPKKPRPSASGDSHQVKAAAPKEIERVAWVTSLKFHLLSQQVKTVNGASGGLSPGHCHAAKVHTSARVTNRTSSTSVSPRPHPHTFYRQVCSLY